jgi:hypothetical protein
LRNNETKTADTKYGRFQNYSSNLAITQHTLVEKCNDLKFLFTQSCLKLEHKSVLLWTSKYDGTAYPLRLFPGCRPGERGVAFTNNCFQIEYNNPVYFGLANMSVQCFFKDYPAKVRMVEQYHLEQATI